MNATISVICFKSKTLANGEHPLMIRICKDNKKVYKSLGASVQFEHWNFEKNEPRRNCPNRDLIISLIESKKNEYRKQALEFKALNKNFTANHLIEKVDKPLIKKTVKIYFEEQINLLIKEKRIGNADSYRCALHSLLRYCPNLDIYFSDIDFQFLKGYETWMRQVNCSENTIGVYLRALRAVYNKAIKDNIVKKDYYPFDTFKVSQYYSNTRKRAIPKEDILKLVEFDVTKISNFHYPYLQLSKDIFLFSYFGCGINFTDIANLRYKNIIQNRIFYERQKTGKQINFQLQPLSIAIMEKYKKSDISDDDYIFPILDKKVHLSEQQKKNRIHKALFRINKTLKKIGRLAGLNAPLTTYVARHTFATVLKRSGVNTAIISESLGHSSEKITQIYLDSFENTQIDDALKCLL